jgi:death-on-curing protein
VKVPLFLTLAEVLDIHRNQIDLYGGSPGVGDLRLLQSAIAQPEASFAGEWLHSDLFDMAAAYAFHISQNHPFLDGNKRTALATALVFLELNDISLVDPNQVLLPAMLGIAQGKMHKEELAEILRTLPQE